VLGGRPAAEGDAEVVQAALAAFAANEGRLETESLREARLLL
jgi:hypothetical protein